MARTTEFNYRDYVEYSEYLEYWELDYDYGIDFLRVLPAEICYEILLRLDASSLCQLSQTCKDWNLTINNCEFVWKILCLMSCQDQSDIETDRRYGYNWKEIFIRNYGRNGIIRAWKKGKFSYFSSYEDLPENHMTIMDRDTWGEILESELLR